MHSTPVISKLYEPRQYFESPLLQTYSKLHGVIKKKKLKSFIQNLKNPGSNKKFFKFYLKGRLFVYYDDCPPKADSKPKLVVYIQEIQALEKAFKGKEDHLKIQLRNKEIELKFTSGKEMMLWHEALQFFRDCYSATPLRRIRGYKENVDVETLLDIAAENETEKWEQIKGKYDYTSFFKDKKLEDLFMLFPMGQISNRVLLGNLKRRPDGKRRKR